MNHPVLLCHTLRFKIFPFNYARWGDERDNRNIGLNSSETGVQIIERERQPRLKLALSVICVPVSFLLMAYIAEGQSTKEKVAKFERACARIMHGPPPIFHGHSTLDLEKYWVEGFDEGVPWAGLTPLSNTTDDRKALAVAIGNQIGMVGGDAYGDFRMLLACAKLLQPLNRSPTAGPVPCT